MQWFRIPSSSMGQMLSTILYSLILSFYSGIIFLVYLLLAHPKMSAWSQKSYNSCCGSHHEQSIGRNRQIVECWQTKSASNVPTYDSIANTEDEINCKILSNMLDIINALTYLSISNLMTFTPLLRRQWYTCRCDLASSLQGPFQLVKLFAQGTFLKNRELAFLRPLYAKLLCLFFGLRHVATPFHNCNVGFILLVIVEPAIMFCENW